MCTVCLSFYYSVCWCSFDSLLVCYSVCWSACPSFSLSVRGGNPTIFLKYTLLKWIAPSTVPCMSVCHSVCPSLSLHVIYLQVNSQTETFYCKNYFLFPVPFNKAQHGGCRRIWSNVLSRRVTRGGGKEFLLLLVNVLNICYVIVYSTQPCCICL